MFNERGPRSTSEQNESPERLNIERQKKKLVGFYLSQGGESYRYISESNTDEFSEKRRLPEEEQLAREILRDYYNDDIKEKERSLLMKIGGPDMGPDRRPLNRHSIETIFNGMAGSKHQKRILAYMTGLEWNMYDSASEDNVARFLDEYKTPIDFEEAASSFLRDIRENNDERKAQEYVEAMEEFQQRMYGKKYEYYKAMKEMRAEAQAMIDEAVVEQVGFSEISKFEAKKILWKTKFEGDPTMVPGKPEKMIGTRELEKSGLEPRFKISLEGAEYNVSRAFKVGTHDAVICYMKAPDGKTIARSYYRSGSQGMWRYLPDYGVKYGGGFWYGKGAGEQQLTLPVEIQGPLNEITERSEIIERPSRTDLADAEEECFLGTAKRIQNTPIVSSREYSSRRKAGEIRDALGIEVQNNPWQRLEKQEDVKPEDMEIPRLLAPNFSKQVGEFNLESETYGKATVRSYASNNGSLVWSVVEDEYGRACIGGAQVKSKITSTGLRQAWVDVGDFATPLYEYPRQAHGVGDYSDIRGPYVGMWRGYLSKMPVIREYVTTRRNMT